MGRRPPLLRPAAVAKGDPRILAVAGGGKRILAVALAVIFVPVLLWPGSPARAHGSFHERLAAMDARIAADPGNATLYLARADLYRHHRDFEPAAADIQRAEAMDPALPDVELLRGRLLRDTGRLEEADAALSRFLARSPDDASGLEARAEVRMALGRNLPAARDYDRAIAHQGIPSPEAYVRRARALAAAGDEYLAEAIAGLDAGLALMGPVATLEQVALELELRRGATDAALARLDRSAARSPRKDTWLARRGQILESAGRDEEARLAYEQALAEHAKLPPARRRAAASRDLERLLEDALRRLPPSPGPKEP